MEQDKIPVVEVLAQLDKDLQVENMEDILVLITVEVLVAVVLVV